MAEATPKKPAESQSQDAGHEGDQPEFLLEKFSSVEDQAKGYIELEKKYHSDLDTLKNEVKLLKKGVPVEDTHSYTPPPKDDDSQELIEFYRSPSDYRRRVKDEVKQELRQENQQLNAIQQTLQRFFTANPDLVGQEPLVEWYVRQEDPRLEPQDRLSNAAKRTREHITNLRKAPDSRPNPDEFVDEPSGSQPHARSTPMLTEEQERAAYFTERAKAQKARPARSLPQGE